MQRSLYSNRRKGIALLALGVSLLCCGCANLPHVKQNLAPTRIFLADFSTTWTAALESVSMGRDVVRVQNRELGVIETAWIDSSEFRQFLDVFSDEDFFLRSRYKLQVHVREGTKNGQPAVLVRILKQAQKENTFLGGWQEEESDGIEESVCLYRIGRLIAMQQANEAQNEQLPEIEDGDTLF